MIDLPFFTIIVDKYVYFLAMAVIVLAEKWKIHEYLFASTVSKIELIVFARNLSEYSLRCRCLQRFNEHDSGLILIPYLFFYDTIIFQLFLYLVLCPKVVKARCVFCGRRQCDISICLQTRFDVTFIEVLFKENNLSTEPIQLYK